MNNESNSTDCLSYVCGGNLKDNFILESLDCGDPYLRRNFIGASDAPIIMGLSPWRTPLELYKEKIGLIGSQQETEPMRQGKIKEEEARKVFENLMGETFNPMRLFSKEYDWMMASLDGISKSGGVVEIKCPGEASYKKSKALGIAEMYQCQMQHQMYVANTTEAHYFCYLRENEFHQTILNRDDEFIEEMIKKEIEFWDCVQNLREPEYTERDYIHKDDFQLTLLTMELNETRKKIKYYKDQEMKFEERLIEYCEGKNTKCNGMTLKKVARKGSIDYSSVAELDGVDLEKYRKENSSYWKITFEDEE